jgi:vanillate/3-O-methylgallate O-demethylase
VGRLMTRLVSPGGGNLKQLHIPIEFDTLEPSYDKITVDGKFVGTGNYTAYSANERAIITLSIVDQGLQIGDEVTLHWGEAGGGSGKGRVEPTDDFAIRAVVSPTPFARVARAERGSAKRGH